ncbi:MAG: tetratricopeptide repeat protein, partial [Muribaculaceae bacterium]|nr:tetratricopeptide repeat protein [Muribaculaceae bacterium]
MRTFLLYAFIMTCLCPAWGQTVQRGVVREYNERAAKTPLAGVELRVTGAGSTVSGKDGAFALEFLTLEPGQRVNVRRIEKEGYVLFNKEAVEQWNLNPSSPFVLVMCRADRFKRIRDNYYRNSEERYAAQYKKERDELARLQKEGRLKDEEYRKRLAEVSDSYERQLDNLDSYVDRFARIDLSEISGTEQKIIELVEAGRFDEAIQKYDDLRIKEKLVETLGQRRQVQNAIQQLTAAESSMGSTIDSLYASAERQIATLRLAGGVENNRKILAIYREIADADTTNVDWLLTTGRFIVDYIADYSDALSYYQKALNAAIQQSGENNAITATCYNNIGYAYSSMSKYQQALEYYQKSLKIWQEIHGENHPDVATSYNNLGMLYSSRGDYQHALEYNQKALKIWSEIYGEKHPDVATSYNNIGAIYSSLGESQQALEYLQKALSIRLDVFGENHPDVATSYNNIGYAYNSLGKYQQALEHYQKALKIQSELFGENHPDVARSYNNIGGVYSSLGENQQALEYYQRARKIQADLFGEKHSDVATSYNNIGNVYSKQGNYQLALEYLQKALSIRLDV